MSLGAILVGLAIAVLTSAYIARPFRAVAARAAAPDVDKLIEAWVRATPAAPPVTEDTVAPVALPQPTSRTSPPPVGVNFCPQCGRQVAPDHRFCPGCGARLPYEEGAI